MKNLLTDTSRGSLAQYLHSGNLSFFGCRGPVLPDLLQAHQGTASVFVTKGVPFPNKTYRARCARYASLSDVREERSDVYFLDHEATKVLFAEFPATARYVLVRLTPRLSWFVALPGLLRRLPKKLVSIEGVVTLPAGNRNEKWLV